MATIAIITSSIGSIRIANSQLGRRLADHGHDVSVLEVGADLPALLGRGLRVRGDVELTGRGDEARTSAIEGLGLEAARQTLLDRRADAVLVDIEEHEWVAVASTLGVPIATTSVWITPLRHRLVPPLDRHDPAPIGFAARVRNELHWWRRRAVTPRLRAAAWRATGGADRLSVLDAFTRRHGVRFSRLVDTGAWLRPWAYHLPTLVFAPAELDFVAHPSLHHVGPMFVPLADEPLPAEVERLARRRGSTLVYCSFGTLAVGYDTSQLERVVEAARRRPDWSLVIGLGSSIDPSVLGELPDNVAALRWVPQRAVLERAEVAISHGGIASIMECVAAGVPMLAYAGIRDQPGNVARLVHHGIGHRGDPVDGIDDLVARIDALRVDPDVADSIEAMAAAMRGYEDRAAAVVSRLLAGELPAH